MEALYAPVAARIQSRLVNYPRLKPGDSLLFLFERAAGGDADLHRELVILRAEGDRLRELIQECRADKRLLEGLLHAEKQEKAMILERIPVPPSRFEGWWGRARRRLRGGDGE